MATLFHADMEGGTGRRLESVRRMPRLKCHSYLEMEPFGGNWISRTLSSESKSRLETLE